MESFLKLGFILLFLSLVFILRMPIDNPIGVYFPWIVRLLDGVAEKIRFFESWGVFCKCSEEFIDLKITARYANGTKVWYFKRDKGIPGLDIYSDIARLTLVIHSDDSRFFFCKAIFNAVNKIGGDLRALTIELVRCSSLYYDDRNNCKPSEVLMSWKK